MHFYLKFENNNDNGILNVLPPGSADSCQIWAWVNLGPWHQPNWWPLPAPSTDRMVTGVSCRWRPLRTCLWVDAELPATGLVHHRVDRVEETFVVIEVRGRHSENSGAHCCVFPHINGVRRLAEHWPVVIDVQHGHSNLHTVNVPDV